MNSRTLIIVGMHRSGTSLITNWLNRCGLFVGDQLVGMDVGNLDGHFEDENFLFFHQQFLKNRKLPSTGFVTNKVSPLDLNEIKDLNALIEKRNSKHRQWGWKEPRTVLFLNNYRQLLPKANYVFIIRNFSDTVSSLLIREYKTHIKKGRSKKGISKIYWQLFKRKSREQVLKKYAEKYLKVWIHYSQEILNYVQKLELDQVCFVNYEALSSQDQTIFNRLAFEWNYSLNYIPFSEVFKKDLISTPLDFEPFIKNKALITEANKTERFLKEYLNTFGMAG